MLRCGSTSGGQSLDTAIVFVRQYLVAIKTQSTTTSPGGWRLIPRRFSSPSSSMLLCSHVSVKTEIVTSACAAMATFWIFCPSIQIPYILGFLLAYVQFPRFCHIHFQFLFLVMTKLLSWASCCRTLCPTWHYTPSSEGLLGAVCSPTFCVSEDNVSEENSVIWKVVQRISELSNFKHLLSVAEPLLICFLKSKSTIGGTNSGFVVILLTILVSLIHSLLIGIFFCSHWVLHGRGTFRDEFCFNSYPQESVYLLSRWPCSSVVWPRNRFLN